jgi:xanthine dehydrogenase/oxidase
MIPAPLFLAALMGIVGGVLAYVFRGFFKRLIRSENDGEDSEPLLPATELTCTRSLSMKDIQWSNVLTIFVNGNSITLTNPDPSELLVTFIREKVGLKGTKLGCEEGGCGACTVVLTKPEGIVSVNSCLRPLCANDGLAVTTVEGIGSTHNDDLSQEQKRLVANNGTQCGFCTPGWITNMHALNQSNEVSGNTSTKREIDAYLDGNICRCTGYRPILQAFQSFAGESGSCGGSKSDKVHPCVANNCSTERMQACVSKGHDIDTCSGPDMEDCSGAQKATCGTAKCCPGSVSKPLGTRRAGRDLALVRAYTPQPLLFFNPVTGQRWIRPVNLAQLCAVIRDVASTPAQSQYVQLVGGNTSIGVTKYLNGTGPYNAADKYSTFIDVNQVQEMVAQAYSSATAELTVGAATSLSTLIALLEQYAATGTSAAMVASDSNVRASESATGHVVNHHSTFSVTANHLSKIANTQVRNAGSWAGNLMVFLKYPTFPSDAVLALTTAGAQLKVCDRFGNITLMDMPTFMGHSLVQFQNQGLMLIGLTISDVQRVDKTPTASAGSALTEFVTETFKVAQRARNAHAHVNAGFQFDIEVLRLNASGAPICRNSRVVFGGVSDRIFVAYRCQSALQNAPLTAETLGRALVALQLDLTAVGQSGEVLGSQSFRVSVMQSCLYRALLRCYPIYALPANLTSAVLPWVMPISRGVELFVPPKGADGHTPIGKPVHKLEGKIQATGEAKYPSDEPMSAQGLYGAIVFSTQCAKKLVALDYTVALALPGVVSVLTAADIPGQNVGNGCPYLFVPIGETVETVGAQLGVVVATSEAAANQAASLVVATYQGDSAPITNLQQAVAKQSFFPNGT